MIDEELKSDDRGNGRQMISEHNLYCTVGTAPFGHGFVECKYAVNNAKGNVGCSLFLNGKGKPQALKWGREAQTIRCQRCRDIPVGNPIPKVPEPQEEL